MNLHTDRIPSNSYIANVQYFKKLNCATYLLLFGCINKNSLDGEPSNYLKGNSTLKIYMAEGHFNLNSPLVAKIVYPLMLMYTLLSGKFI